MWVFSSLLLFVLLNMGFTAHAETQVDPSLKSGYEYVNLSEQSDLEATSLLMLGNDNKKDTKLIKAPQKAGKPNCIFSNKQFVHCIRQSN